MIHPYTVTFQRDIVNRKKRKEKNSIYAVLANSNTYNFLSVNQIELNFKKIVCFLIVAFKCVNRFFK